MTSKSTFDKHWGELPSKEMHKQVITTEIIENIWRQVFDDSNNTDCDYKNDQQSEFIQLPMGEPHVLNTINLHHQLRSMKNGLILRGISEIDMGELPTLKRSYNLFNFSCPHPEKDKSKKTSMIHLQSSTARNLLKHSAIVLVAHIGYENTTDIAIDTLTDIADNFLKKISILLKGAFELKADVFPDAIERVFREIGVGSAIDIHNYYQDYILKFERRMLKEAKIMVENQQYQLEFNSIAKREYDTVHKLAFDDLEAFSNMYNKEVPTLQFLDPSIGFPQNLDAGFQMLHSLEQDELNSLEVEEEVGDSPSGQSIDNKT